MIRRLSLTGSLAVLILTASTAYATPITYNVNQTIGLGGVVGTITTDGTIGSLANANILDWTLTISDGTAVGPLTLRGPLSGQNSAVQIFGSSFTASLTNLFFNFSNTTHDTVQFQNPNLGSGMNVWCLEGALDGCIGNNSSQTVERLDFAAKVSVAQSGVQSIAAAQTAAVPEPTTLLLVGSGAAVGAARRRLKKH